MKSTKLEFGGLELDLRLDVKSITRIEKALDESMITLMPLDEGKMKLPPTHKLLLVLQGANQKPGITKQRIYEAFEKFLEEGKTTMDLFSIIAELLMESGFFGKVDQENQEEELSQDVEMDDL